METVELVGLGRRFGRRWALRGIDLSVEEGEMVAVWGNGGSGKTTLLYLLSTLLRPHEGKAWIDGHDLRQYPLRVRSVMSMGFQTSTLAPTLTAFEALDLRATMHGVPRAHRTNAVVHLLQLMGLGEYHQVPVSLLSTSFRRCLEVAAALLPQPRVLFLDEPFSGVDTETVNRIWEYLFDLRSRERTTLLVATSDAAVAERCHRIAVLNQGRLLACDTPDMIRSAVGKDIVTVQPLDERLTARRLHERLQVVVNEEEDGFKIEVQRGDSVAADILGSFGGQTSAIYVRRPSLEAGLRRIVEGNSPENPTANLLLETQSLSDS
jgi:ABC-2 type transport system ATP-binding protein